MGFIMTCIDISSESIEICKKRLPDTKCILGNKDDETLPVQLSSQSMILCIEVPLVIQSNWFLPEISRALKPGGVMIGIWWNKLSIRGLIAHYTVKYRKEFDFYKNHTLVIEKN